MSRVVVVRGRSPSAMVEAGLEYFDCPSGGRVVLKPNLIAAQPPPTTTPCETVEALARYYLERGCEVVVAEGSGWCDTFEAYGKLGYLRLQELGVRLIDLNRDSFEVVEDPRALFLKRFELPVTLREAYIVSVPVLKEHSITGVTLSLKNMLGATLGEEARVARKGRFHVKLDESIVDINLYLKPKLAVIDGRVAGLGGELRSHPRELGIMVFSSDLVAADAIGARWLGKDPERIRHIQLAQRAGLGTADLSKIEVIEVDAGG